MEISESSLKDLSTVHGSPFAFLKQCCFSSRISWPLSF